MTWLKLMEQKNAAKLGKLQPASSFKPPARKCSLKDFQDSSCSDSFDSDTTENASDDEDTTFDMLSLTPQPNFKRLRVD